MVRGLFPRGEREAVLGVLARSVPATVGDVVRQARWLGTAWRLANLYLRSIGARPLGPGAPDLVGISEETTCWVSSEYFRPNGRFEEIRPSRTFVSEDQPERLGALIKEFVREPVAA